jgi:beta-mannosidase
MTLRSLVLFSMFSISLYSCHKEERGSYVKIEIASGWELQSGDDSIHIDATVPGTIAGDLYKSEEIESPYIADNINTLDWIDRKEWIYSVVFDVPREIIRMDSVSLNFSGLKGLAEIVLNDTVLGTVNSYFDKKAWVCKKLLKVRGNKLSIKFRSVEKLKEEGLIEACYPVVSQGTSVSPRFLSGGISDAVQLEAWSGARIRDVFVYTDSLDHSHAILKVKADVEAIRKGNYEHDIYINSQKVDQTQALTLKPGIQPYAVAVTIPNPEIWWCNGMGKPAIYELTVVLKKGKIKIDQQKTTFGIRKIELSDRIDSVTNAKHFRLNGQPVFIKGANYLPVNLFQLEPDPANYERIISKAAAAHINMLRVWGGGVYEKSLFYDLCDKYGIMVWQDITIPDIDKTSNNLRVTTSLADELVRLRNHPCMALFYIGREQVNTIPPIVTPALNKELLSSDTLLCGYIKELAVNIPYYSALQEIPKKKNDKTGGIQTFWPVWYSSSPLSAYTTSKAGIITEFGVQSIPDIKTAETFDSDNEFDLRSPLTDAHQFNKITLMGSDLNGNQMLGAYLQMYYNDPSNNESLLYLSQIFQAQALKFAIENFRITRPSCMGSFFWHFNDCWPSISWSVVDFYNRNKPAYYTIKDAYSNVAVIPEKMNDVVKLWVVNDSLLVLNGDVTIETLDFNGNRLYYYSSKVSLKPGSVGAVCEKNTRAMFAEKDANKVVMHVTLTNKGKVVAENLLYFVDPLFLDLPEPDINMQITNKENRFQVIFKSATLVKNLVLFTRDRESVFSDNNIDLLPGHTYTISVDYDGTQSDFENDLQVISLVDSF